MSDTYAVVNKPKHAHPPVSSPAYSVVTVPSGSRSLPPAHHYDNDPAGASAAALYSTVHPRAKPLSLQYSAAPVYDPATSANHRLGEGPPSLGNNGEYQLMPDELVSPADDDYEDLSPSVSDVTGVCSPGGVGFNYRVQKPRGPRDPPAEWSRLER